MILHTKLYLQFRSALKWHYAADTEHQNLGEARANACEITAWRFLSKLAEREAVDFCLYELPEYEGPPRSPDDRPVDHETGEIQPLLSRVLPGQGSPSSRARVPIGSSTKKSQLLSSLSRLTNFSDDNEEGSEPTDAFRGLNALEIAAIADAKRFLSQNVVQKIITGIWNGDIVFWDSMSVKSTKAPRIYNPRTADPFSRLRVPKYMKSWEILFFAIFLCLYYAVLIGRNDTGISGVEIALFIWIAAFCYDELSEWIDAGSVFYAADVWNLFDMIIVVIGLVFASLSRLIGPCLEEFALTK